jgi:hypothetical protein
MNKMIIVTSIFSMAVLTACGGGGSTDPKPFPGGVNGVDPVSELTLKQRRQILVDSRTALYISEGGYDGKIQYFTQHYNEGTSNEVFQLASGTSSLDIRDVQRDKSTDVSCADGSTLKVKIYSDFSSGEVITTGTHKGIDISCKSKYNSLLPTNVFDQTSITALLHDWGADRSVATYSDCTHLIEDMNGFSKNCTGEELVNYTITDTSGKKHKITTKVTFEGDK